MLLYLRKILMTFVFPPGIFIIISLIILILILYKKRKSSLFLSLILIFVMFFLSSRVGECILLKPLEDDFKPVNTVELNKEDLKDTAIAVLAGGYVIGSPASEKAGGEIGETTLARMYGGLKIYNELGCDICVSGGILPGNDTGVSIAEVMKDVYVNWNVPEDKIIVENRSRTTLENGEFSIQILKEKGYENIILVTSALHMKRSVKCFENRGMKIIPAPTNYIFETTAVSITDILPNSNSLGKNLRALHEWVGLLYYGFGCHNQQIISASYGFFFIIILTLF